MANNVYDVGDKVRITATFTLNDGSVVDPSTVTFQYRLDTGSITSKVYGTDADVKKEGVGVYYLDIDCDIAGLWHYRTFSTGNGKAAAEGKFTIRASHFA